MDWHPPEWLLNTGFLAVVGGIVLGVLRLIGPWRRQISEAEERLRKEAFEGKAHCEAELARRDVELRLVRHRERGSRQLIYSLLHAAEMPAGEKRDGALASVRATLAEMERVEMLELGVAIKAMIDPTTATEMAYEAPTD